MPRPTENLPTAPHPTDSHHPTIAPSESSPQILLLSHLYPRPKAPSAGIFIENWMRALAREGLGIRVISPQVFVPPLLGHLRRYQGYVGPTRDRRHGLDMYRPKYLRPPGRWFRRLEPRFVLQAVRPIALRLHKTQPADVVLGVNLLPDGWAAVELGRMLHLPVVVNAIGSDVNIIPRMGPHTHRLACEVCQQADLLLCQSQAIRQSLLAMGADPQRTLRFWRGLDLEAFGSVPNREACRAQWPEVSLSQKLIVFVGQIVRSKGVFDLVEALAGLGPPFAAQCRLALVGELTELSAVLRRARALGVADRLVVTGLLGHEQALRWIRAADILVLPSYAEGLPNVVLEAMALGTPVVASRAGGLAELATMDQPFFDIEAGDVAALTRSLQDALGDPRQSQAMAARARRLVQEHFDAQKNSRRLLDLMKSLSRRP